jgi:uncharacterized protein YjiS (DUF1127 family)
MSTQFRHPPKTFVKHDALKLFEANSIATGVEHTEPRLKKNCNNPVVRKSSPGLLREGHIVFLAVDVLVALHASFRKWRNHRRTLRALADLDEHQLRDIGLTRGEALSDTAFRLVGRCSNYRALAQLDDTRRVD